MTPPAQPEIATGTGSSPAEELKSLLQGAGVSRLDRTGWIRVTGADRVRWLNGMVTNSIQGLSDGEGTYNFLLSVQGRIQGDATIFAEPDALLIETDLAQVPGMMPLLDRFIIMDEVELAEVASAGSGILVAGPQAAALLARISLSIENPGNLERRTLSWNAGKVTVIHAYSPLVPRYELWAEPDTTAKLFEALVGAGAIVCDSTSLEWLRILEGTPLLGTDIRDRELPQETGQTRALHFNKGCYLGQEIVERIRSRGNVHRAFAAFRLEGEVPPAGSSLELDGKTIGELTSTAAIPLPGNNGETVRLGLGYIRREALERGASFHYPGGVAIPVSVPFGAAAATTGPAASESSERV
jgi:folate-binding protein YgfZ